MNSHSYFIQQGIGEIHNNNNLCNKLHLEKNITAQNKIYVTDKGTYHHHSKISSLKSLVNGCIPQAFAMRLILVLFYTQIPKILLKVY